MASWNNIVLSSFGDQSTLVQETAESSLFQLKTNATICPDLKASILTLIKFSVTFVLDILGFLFMKPISLPNVLLQLMDERLVLVINEKFTLFEEDFGKISSSLTNGLLNKITFMLIFILFFRLSWYTV